MVLLLVLAVGAAARAQLHVDLDGLESGSNAAVVIRLNNEQPIVDMSFEGVGTNINGPSLIRIPDWIDPADRTDPSAIYYLYFANHGGDNIEKVNFRRGPWLRCVQETIISDHICGFAIILA